MATPDRALPAVLFDVAVDGLGVTLGDLALHAVVDLTCDLDREAVASALSELVADFPVLGCRFVPRFWRSRWRPLSQTSAAETVLISEEPLEAVIRRPLADWPLRVTLIPGASGTQLVVSVRHQVADGGGLLAIVGELAARITGEGPQRRQADRGFGQLIRSLRLRQLPILLWGLWVESARPLLLPRLARTPMALAEPRPEAPRPIFRTVTADFAEGSNLRAMCRRLGCTINDALVAALAKLNAELSSKGLLGNYFTVDLRRYLEGNDEARVTNLSGVESVILRREQAETLEAATRAIAGRTERLKRQLVGLPWVMLPVLLTFWVPHGLARFCSKFIGRWMLTLMDRGLIVTNIGAMDDALSPFGDEAIAASVVGPCVRGARIPTITATGFRGRVTLQLNAFDDIDSGELDRVASRLEAIFRGQ